MSALWRSVCRMDKGLLAAGAGTRPSHARIRGLSSTASRSYSASRPVLRSVPDQATSSGVTIRSVGVAGVSKKSLSAKYSPDPTPNSRKSCPTLSSSPAAPLPPTFQRYGEDAAFLGRQNYIGVADGVGGWKKHGVDPGVFALALMQSCSAASGVAAPSDPRGVLVAGYHGVAEGIDPPVFGGSTACLGHLDEHNGVLRIANLGDSGFRLIRGGKVAAASSEQRHSPFTPWQLTIAPAGQDMIEDQPEAAELAELLLEPGDIVVLATDGLFDNVYDDEIEFVLDDMGRNIPPASEIAESLVNHGVNYMMARDRMSPFAARANDDGFCMLGGKMDDVTVCVVVLE